jgi:TonB family protein
VALAVMGSGEGCGRTTPRADAVTASDIALPIARHPEGLRPPDAGPRLVMSSREVVFEPGNGRDPLRLPPDFRREAATERALFDALARRWFERGATGRAAPSLAIRADRTTPTAVITAALLDVEQAQFRDLQIVLAANGREVALPLRLPSSGEAPPPGRPACARATAQLTTTGTHVSVGIPGDPFVHEVASTTGACPAVPPRDGRPDAEGLAAYLAAAALFCPEPRVAAGEGARWDDVVGALEALARAPGVDAVGFARAMTSQSACESTMSIRDLALRLGAAAPGTLSQPRGVFAGLGAPARATGVAPEDAGVRRRVVVRALPASVSGLLAPAAVRRVVEAGLATVDRCATGGGPPGDRGGRLTLRFVIGGSGRVLAVEVTASADRDAAVERCLVQAVRAWRFPAPEGGGIVRVEQPVAWEERAGP